MQRTGRLCPAILLMTYRLIAVPLHDAAYTGMASVYVVLSNRVCRLNARRADRRLCTADFRIEKEL